MLALAGILGVAADRLLWVDPVGPGFALWIALLGAAAVLVAHRAREPWTISAASWAGVAVAAAATQSIVDADLLALPMGVVLLVSASMVLLRAADVRLGETSILDHVVGLAMVPARAAAGVLPLLGDLQLPADPRRRRVAAVARGVFLAAPLVVAFGTLFAAADATFDRWTTRLISLWPENLVLHVPVILIFGWIAAGLLWGVRSGSVPPLPDLNWRRLGAEETATVLGLLSSLFLTFVGLQLGYLFGGRATIEATSGLTLAEYARRGFFELILVAGLTLAVLLFSDAVSGARRVFRALAGLLVGCVTVILVSAAQRLSLYTAEFGLTLDRILAAATLVWLAVVLSLFAGTVLRERPRRFASGAVIAGIAVAFALVLLNPAARAARSNLDRAAEGKRDADVDYLLGLGADAVPTLVERLDELPETPRCEAATRLLERWGRGAIRSGDLGLDDWRSWNAARAAAREAVTENAAELRTLAEDCDRSSPS